MRKGFGICCIVLGIGCLIASLGLIACNYWEAEKAQVASMNILQDVRGNMLDNTHAESKRNESVEIPGNAPREMPTAQVDGDDCIGVLSIPVLELELPVLTDWSYTKLKIAPCHYFGSYYEKDFVIAAHNYQSHFGRLSELHPKDLILFTDIFGKVYYYEVVLLETLSGDATEEMISSGFDLSLYTCTPGGANRITVRCKKMMAENAI